MKIAVKSFHKAQEAIDAREFDYVISLLAKEGDDRCPKRGANHFIEHFDDAEVEEVFHEGKMWYGPTKLQISDLLVRAARIPPDASVLVHCTAGKSRSTAVAMGVLMMNGYKPQEALDAVVEARKAEGSDIVVPNRLIVRYIDELLWLDGEFIKVIDDFYEQLSHRIPLELLKRGRHTPEEKPVKSPTYCEQCMHDPCECDPYEENYCGGY